MPLLQKRCEGLYRTCMSITCWVLSDSPNRKVGWVQEHSVIRCKWYIWAQELLGLQLGCTAAAPDPHISYHCHPSTSPSGHPYGFMGSPLRSTNGKGKWPTLFLRLINSVPEYKTKMTGCYSVTPLREALKGRGEENFPKDRASDRAPDHPLLHGKRRSLREDYIWHTE